MINSIDILLLLISISISVIGFIKIFQRWKIGQQDPNIKKNFKSAMSRVFKHTDVLREREMGFFHLFLFYLFVVAILLVIIFQFPIKLIQPLAFLQSLALDVIGFIALSGVIFFLYRRYKVKDRGFDNKGEDFVILYLLLVILSTGFLMEALRVKVDGRYAFSPIGTVFSVLIPGIKEYYPTLSIIFWRLHFFSILLFIAYLPFSKLAHLILIPYNYMNQSTAPKGVYKLLDLDNAEEFGANKLSDLTWKDLLDLDTCVRCGRCHENCPANLTQKPLSPKKVIQDLKKVLDNYKNNPTAPLINEDITDEVVFACTTCRACVENCPAGIDHLNKMIELKRYLVLMEGSISPEAQLLFKNLERNGNPWGMPASTRGEWAKELNVPFLAELDNPEEIDFLFWPGCAGAFDDRYMKVVKRCVEIFKQAGIRFALLGEEETCCGDPARKLGNEYLYDMLARQNVETMNNYKVKKIVTSCPHCFNTIAKDYRQIDGNYEVLTHSQVILSLIKEGRIKVNKQDGVIVYHDSCYLARYNGIYDEPREIIKSTGVKLVEFERRGIKGFCCGGGGGNMFLEEHTPRMNDTRISQILESPHGKDLTGVAVACPFCLTMMIDGTKTYNKEEEIAVKDISELVYDAMEKN
ncbi:MAG: heterodisulfide reductase-related iron-sulfur binding cluster [Proteobacteria bacterium]|nr:heterodisulfide reductase-related iron-sulfur binding cluster [Pseudomonadota bacterium]